MAFALTAAALATEVKQVPDSVVTAERSYQPASAVSDLHSRTARDVPEPGGFALFGTGLLTLAGLMRWRMRSLDKDKGRGHEQKPHLEGTERPAHKPVKAVAFVSKSQSKAAGGNAA